MRAGVLAAKLTRPPRNTERVYGALYLLRLIEKPRSDLLQRQNTSVPSVPILLSNSSRFNISSEMELSPRISCWTTRIALLVTFVVLMVNFDNQHNVASASPVPLSGFEDYTEDRVSGDQPSLYELLLQRELLADKLDADARGHLVVRKSDRSPSLRLRFGRRADPDVPRISPNQHD